VNAGDEFPGARFVSRSGVSPGSLYRWRSETRRSPSDPNTSTSASSAASATARSEACVATHNGLVPNKAAWRFSPESAPHPLPGFLLLQASCSLRKYGQRVRCNRLPPTVAILRICPLALARIASAIKG